MKKFVKLFALFLMSVFLTSCGKDEGLRNLPFGILGANDGSIWFASGSGVSRYDGKTITDFKSKEGQK